MPLNAFSGRRYRHAQTNAKRILERADLRAETSPATYQIETDAGTTLAMVKGSDRRVLETLRDGPMLSALPVRIGQYIHRLREAGFTIETVWKTSSAKSGEVQRFWEYHLTAAIVPVDQEGCE